jgi:hypothetical protein
MAAPGVSIDIKGCMTALDNEGREFVVRHPALKP